MLHAANGASSNINAPMGSRHSPATRIDEPNP
jgi:hypothetical protein